MNGPTTTTSAIEQEALRHYVRSRAPDFGADERRALDAWLAEHASHRTAFRRLEQTWQRLDGLADAFKDERAVLMRERKRPAHTPGRWLFAAMASAAAAMLVFAVPPGAGLPRHFETTVAQQRTISLPAGIDVAINADSAIDVVDGDPIRIDLVRGDMFVDVGRAASGHLEVRAGNAVILDIGTRFSVSTKDRGGSLAVEEGQVELRTGPARLFVGAGQGADFDAGGHVEAHSLGASAVAPWRERRWQFDATSLAVVSGELWRQQGLRVDVADAAVAALTVSGTFAFDEPDQVLWAVAQVHGLRLKRIGERHFALARR